MRNLANARLAQCPELTNVQYLLVCLLLLSLKGGLLSLFPEASPSLCILILLYSNTLLLKFVAGYTDI